MMQQKCPTVPSVFAGADVFITGGSGFMGKVLIEKLLRSCPQIARVFVLMRAKRGKALDERLKTITDGVLFDVLKGSNPAALNKIHPIEGDCTQLRLGMSAASVERMREVQFVFHAAASVRFDDPLKDAILINTRSTREVLEWAKTLPKLRAVVHISTTYCNPELMRVEEKIYPPKMDWREAIRMAESFDTAMLETVKEKLTQFAPNTYTYTKGLAEQICHEYRNDVPLVVFRPSIVTNSESEPLVGWVDNFNGPIGLLLGCASGVVRAGLLDLEKRINCIPVDVSIKAIIVAAWKRATLDAPGTLSVYNSAAEPEKTINYGTMLYDGKMLFERTPLGNMLWAPGGTTTSNKYLFYLLFFCCQLLPALLVDALLRVAGRAPFLLKLNRKIFDAQVSLRYFMNNEWVFANDNFKQLEHTLLKDDRKDFSTNFFLCGMMEYYARAILGGRRYLLKEPDENIADALKKYRRLRVLNFALKGTMVCLIAYCIYSRYLA
ncbi:putative fatty acyl-CoA reductase CG5065 [Anopheles marshallii]|uniref:putative fatty acyl-CoA reductase CG5065 n=1 Tax=Anopheles marshallii TaxID=1521116 RepID=UPI00237A232A|nr:putative fatty acyl-CoA reductase CG5065 [Anopheles marshallii]